MGGRSERTVGAAPDDRRPRRRLLGRVEAVIEVLTERELNRAVLARQLLLDRAELAPPEALERVAGLQTQYAPTGYVGLWSRTAAFHRDDLTAALHDGTVVQCWMQRCTIHMVAAADHAPFTAAVRDARRQWWLRLHKPLGEVEMAAAAAAVRGYLAHGPAKQAEIQRRLAADGHPKLAWPGVQLWLDLVRVPPAGTWGTPRAHVYGLAGDVDVDVAAGEEHLAARYLRAFGPASVKDVASFCGWPVTATRAVLARLDVLRFRDEAGGELVDTPGAPQPPPDTPAPPRFLGPWDAVLLAHARRGQILPERHRPRVFAVTMPQSTPTFLVDGQVAGTWKHVDGEVRVEPFEPLPPAAAAAVEAEAAALAAWYRAG